MPWITTSTGKRIWQRDDTPVTPVKPKLGANAGTGVIKTLPQNPTGTPIPAVPKTSTGTPLIGGVGRGVDVTPPREQATIATPDSPIKTIASPTSSSDFAGLDDRAKQVTILRKQADGEALSLEEKDWKINQFLDKQNVSRDDLGLNEYQKALEAQQAQAELELGQKEASLKTESEKAIELKKREIASMLANRESELRGAGEREKEAAGTALSFSGFGRSTFSADQQAQIQKNVEQQVTTARRASELELEMFKRELSGADDEELAPLRDAVNGLKQQARQFELDSALKVAELNQQNALNFEESFSNLMQTLDPTTQKKFDKDATAALGYMADEFGQPIFGEDGEKVMVNNEDPTEWGSFQDKYGNTVFYDKSNPSNTKRAGGTGVYQNSTGSPSSTPTSNIDGVESLGFGDTYTRDDGTQGTLGENCVKYARSIVPNLPFGLYNKQDKQNAINFAEENGFGSSDLTNVQVGDAILTKEGNVGHAAVVQGIDDQGNLILDEANYAPGQVTQGRTIAKNDPLLLGYISSSDPKGQMNSVINPNAKNEGRNPAISTQTVIQSGEVPEMKFTSKQKNDFKNYNEKDKLPLWVSSPQDEIKFMNELAIYEKQQESGSILNKLDEKAVTNVRMTATQFGNEQIVKNYNDVANKVTSVNRIIDKGIGGPGDLAVVFEFMKALDPTSVVRETEYESAAKSGNIFKGVLAKYNGYLNEQGGFLPPEVKEAFRKIVQTKYEVIDNQYSNLFKQYSKKINNFAGGENVAPELLIDYRVDFGEYATESTKATTKKEVEDAAKQYGMSYEEYSKLLQNDGYLIK